MEIENEPRLKKKINLNLILTCNIFTANTIKFDMKSTVN